MRILKIIGRRRDCFQNPVAEKFMCVWQNAACRMAARVMR
jgi:hypothetical protein